MHWLSTYIFVMIAKNDIEWNIDCNVCKLVFTVFMEVSDVEISTASLVWDLLSVLAPLMQITKQTYDMLFQTSY